MAAGHSHLPFHRPTVEIGVGNRAAFHHGHLDAHRPIAPGRARHSLVQRLMLFPDEAGGPGHRQGQRSCQGVPVLLQPGQDEGQLEAGHRQIRIEPAVRHPPEKPPVYRPAQGLLFSLLGNGGGALWGFFPPGGEPAEHSRQLAPGYRGVRGEPPRFHAAANAYAFGPGHGVLVFLRHIRVGAPVHRDPYAAEAVKGGHGLSPARRFLWVEAPVLPEGQRLPVNRPADRVPALRRNPLHGNGPHVLKTPGALQNFQRHQALRRLFRRGFCHPFLRQRVCHNRRSGLCRPAPRRR